MAKRQRTLGDASSRGRGLGKESLRAKEQSKLNAERRKGSTQSTRKNGLRQETCGLEGEKFARKGPLKG